MQAFDRSIKSFLLHPHDRDNILPQTVMEAFHFFLQLPHEFLRREVKQLLDATDQLLSLQDNPLVQPAEQAGIQVIQPLCVGLKNLHGFVKKTALNEAPQKFFVPTDAVVQDFKEPFREPA